MPGGRQDPEQWSAGYKFAVVLEAVPLNEKKRIRDLEKDLRRKEKALVETAALLVLSRKYEALWTDGEDVIALPQREDMVAAIAQSRQDGACPKPACAELGLSALTFERWQRNGIVCCDGRPDAVGPEPAHKLSQQERE